MEIKLILTELWLFKLSNFGQLLHNGVCSFYAPPQKVAGYYVIPSELWSVCPSVRPRLNIRVRSITLIPFEIISRNLVQI